MRIIDKGEIPNIEVELECPRCDTKFACVESDCRDSEVYDQRDGAYYIVNCPLCKREMTIAKHRFSKNRR